jgi:hypothetical protein
VSFQGWNHTDPEYQITFDFFSSTVVLLCVTCVLWFWGLRERLSALQVGKLLGEKPLQSKQV